MMSITIDTFPASINPNVIKNYNEQTDHNLYNPNNYCRILSFDILQKRLSLKKRKKFFVCNANNFGT